jgi:hypothetical protein
LLEEKGHGLADTACAWYGLRRVEAGSRGEQEGGGGMGPRE